MRVLLVGCVLVGCTSSPNYWVAYQPARGTTPQARPNAMQRATVAITDAGREIESSDADTGIVLSRWFTGSGSMQDGTRFRIRVVLDDAGSYAVDALCQGKEIAAAGGGGWGDNCDTAKRPRFVVDTVAKVEAALK